MSNSSLIMIFIIAAIQILPPLIPLSRPAMRFCNCTFRYNRSSHPLCIPHLWILVRITNVLQSNGQFQVRNSQLSLWSNRGSWRCLRCCGNSNGKLQLIQYVHFGYVCPTLASKKYALNNPFFIARLGPHLMAVMKARAAAAKVYHTIDSVCYSVSCDNIC